MIDRTRLAAIVRDAGALAMGHWPDDGKPLETWEKRVGDPVSVADLAVDAFLRAELGALMPQAGWLSEETPDLLDQRNGDWVWLVDPIDGTRDFIRGRRGWAVSVALVHAGRPMIGALAAPARDEFWWAESGQGAIRNGVALRHSGCVQLVGARVPADILPIKDIGLISVDQPNGIALRLAMVAAGEADLLATLRWGYEWDIAAAALIASEAGAVVTDAFGDMLHYNKNDPRAFGVLASAPALHGDLVARVAERAHWLAG